MENAEIQPENLSSGKQYSKEKFDEYKTQLENEFKEKEVQMKLHLQEEAKKATMSELELARLELEEFKKKYQEKENECTISKQKEETARLLDEAGLAPKVLDIVYVPLDMDGTKSKIDALKSYVEEVKRGLFQSCTTAPVPLVSKETSYDPFIDGFESNEL